MGIIELQNISKSYKTKDFYSSINEVFDEKDSVAFVGHNGCGKSTMLKIIAKIINPTQGKIIYSRKLKIRYVTEKFEPENITAREFLEFMGKIEGLSDKYLENIIKNLAKDFFITDFLDVNMKKMSKGTLQKIIVIQALLNKPDVLLLDEPLSGQDKESQTVFVEKVNNLRANGTTIFMSCHEDWLVKAISNKVYTFSNGLMVRKKECNKTYYILSFYNSNNEPIVSGMIKCGEYYLIRVEECNINSIVLKLIKCGWELRGLKNENDI